MVFKQFVLLLSVAIVAGFVLELNGQEKNDGSDKKDTQTKQQAPDEPRFEEPNPIGETKSRSIGIVDGPGRPVSPPKRKPPKRTQSAGNHDVEESVFDEQGGMTVTDRHGRRTIKIVHNDEIGIYMEVAVTYGLNDTEELTKKHPELRDYVELFPKRVGDHAVGLNIAITSKYSAASLEELQDHPVALSLYRRYYKKRGAAKRNR